MSEVQYSYSTFPVHRVEPKPHPDPEVEAALQDLRAEVGRRFARECILGEPPPATGVDRPSGPS